MGPPTEGVGFGAKIQAEVGGGPPAVVLALLAAQVGLLIDWRSDTTSDTHDSMLSLVSSRGSSLGLYKFPTWLDEPVLDDSDGDTHDYLVG